MRRISPEMVEGLSDAMININEYSTKLDNLNIVNVKDFGAKGDGITDDTSSIQSALDTKNIVYFPTGTYRVNNTLNAYNSIRGQNAEIIMDNDINKTIIEYIDASNIFIEGITLDGGGQPTASVDAPATPKLINFRVSDVNNNYTKNIIIRNNVIKNSVWYGIHVENGENISIHNNEIYNCNCGIVIKAQDTNNNLEYFNIDIKDNYVHTISWIGIMAMGYIDATLYNEVGGGLFRNVNIIRNKVEDCYLVGIELYGRTIGGRVIDNYVTKCGYNSSFGNASQHGAITIKHSQNIIVKDNITTDNNYGIEVIGNKRITSHGLVSYNISISNNIVTNNNATGIIIFQESKDIYITSNTSRENAIGILLTGEDENIEKVIIDKNMVSNNKQGISITSNTKEVKIIDNFIFNNNYLEESMNSRSAIIILGNTDKSNIQDIEILRNYMTDDRETTPRQRYAFYVDYCENVRIVNNVYKGNENNRGYVGSNTANIFQQENTDLINSSAPITYNYSDGDISRNSSPSPGDYMGWVLTGGTWKGFGLIES